MRKALMVVAMFCALSVTACDEEQKQSIVTAANSAADVAAGSTVPWVALAGAGASALLSALGLRRANRASAYADGGWTRDETAELVVALRAHGYKIEGPV